MASHIARKECARPCATMARVTRRAAIERQIEALIDQLDAMDGDADLEDGGDAEPSLGWTKHGGYGFIDDREEDLDTVEYGVR